MRFYPFIMGIIFLSCHNVQAQMPAQQVSGKRTMNSQEAYYSNTTFNPLQTLRIQNGMVWVNGNLVPDAELPIELRSLRKDFFVETSVKGGTEYRFNLMGGDYFLREGKLVYSGKSGTDENGVQSYSNNSNAQGNLSLEGYYANKRQEQPLRFSSMVNEGELHQRCMDLARKYLESQLVEKEALKPALRACLGEWFDINMMNQEAETQKSQQDLDRIKRELEFRKRSKVLILENKMNDLIGN